VDEASLSEEVPWRGPGGGAPSLGTLEDMLRKSPDMGISLHGGPFPAEGNLVCGGGSHTGDFDRCMKEGFFLDPEAIKILSLGAIWNLVKEQGSPELISDYGAQRARL